ncbi:MAG: glycosyltransferase [Anaerolineae bacterium]|jgi:glycosyltransferase involved in cell wall biosynthesis|nr:glycosyltransferase [Anaerolineae bacterium]
MLRVVHLIKVKGIAGAERHLLDLLEGLRARDVDARLLLLTPPDGSAEGMAEAAIQRSIPLERIPINRHLDPGLISRIHRVLTPIKPAIVHVHLWHADLYGTIAARLARVPVVITSRHNDDPRRRQAVLRLLYRLIWQMTDAGIAISEAVKRFTIEVEGVSADKVHTIHYGLPLPVTKYDKRTARQRLRAEIHAPPEAPVLGMVCRLMNAKGLPDAIAAFHQIADQFPDARLVIAGEGDLRPTLEHQIRKLNLTERVHLLGWRDQPIALMAGFDVLLSPSVREGFGLTLLEAMSQAIPIIGSTASAIPEVVAQGQTGLLVPPRDPEALSEAMRVLLQDKPLRMHLGLLGEERLETLFSAANMVDRTLSLYRKFAHVSDT